jgi:hypothetical protein
MRRRSLAASGVATVALVAGGLAWTQIPGEDSPDDTTGADGTATDQGAAASTAEVTRRDLEERAELEGALGYGETSELTLSGAANTDDGDDPSADPSDDGGGGTITGLPTVGSVVDRGQSLLEVDGEPVPLLLGDRPLWRTLGPGVEDGPDVAQLEANLVALGVVTADELTVDEAWTSATTDAVEEWQESLGLEETGSVSPGDLVFLPAAVRVVDHPTPVGGSSSGTVLEVSGTTSAVTIDLEASRRELVAVDQPVEVELPDGTVLPGTVTSVASVATAAESDDPNASTDPTIEVTVRLDEAVPGGTFDEAPVVVRVVTSAAEGVLAVPVDALMALAEGGYAVERVGTGPDGASELVAVELGAFADGWVEVTGDVAEGDQVEVPE